VRRVALVTYLIISSLNALSGQSGWRMSGFNAQRTNTSSVAGPSVLPTFTVLIPNVPGALKRIGDDGFLHF